MKYIIDTNICEKRGLDLSSFLMLLFIKSGASIQPIIDTLIKEEKLVKDEVFNTLYITERWDRVCDEILLKADPSVPEDDRLDKLVDTLMSIFPKGKKNGTQVYWKGNRKDIKERLMKFFKLYNDTYSDEDIITATQKYVASFNGNYTLMRVLKYFIWKATKAVDSNGDNYIEGVSDLATYIENAGEDDNSLDEDWTTELH